MLDQCITQSAEDATIPRMENIEGILQQLKGERDRLDAAINALTSIHGSAARATQGRRSLSAAARARIAAAQRARWAKTRGTKTKARRKISAAGLARIRAAQKARWAKVRAQKQKKAA